ncbi:MAG TPA: ISAzo13 family transposase, partial [Bacteroidetes bacterium]|nr:ISAzo13 family transposase [Bacteroidota bacterium]
MSIDTQLQEKYQMLLPHLDEKTARLFLASEAKSMGRGAKVKVAKLAGVSRARINKGIKELESGKKSFDTDKGQKIRRSGGGRKTQDESQPGLVEALERIVNPHTLGDPMNPLLWTSKSLRKIQLELKAQNYNVGHVTIGRILKSKGYSLQGNK